MSDMNKELNQQAMVTANRLRQIHADFADGDAQSRQDYLSDEVEKVLAEILPDQRSVFLDVLREHFPTWDANTNLQVSSDETNRVQAPSDQREWNDVNYVLERLIELSASLSDKQRGRLIRQLAGAGLTEQGDLSCSDETIQELRSCLKLDKDQTISPARLAEMAVRLASFSHSLDQLVWQIWKNVAPKSKLRSVGIRNVMQRFVKGESDVPLSRDLEQLRHLVASLLSAIAQIGMQFGQLHLARFAPSEIENSAAREPGGMFVAKEVKCWRKYTQLAKAIDDPAAVDSQIKKIIADFVESMPGLTK